MPEPVHHALISKDHPFSFFDLNFIFKILPERSRLSTIPSRAFTFQIIIDLSSGNPGNVASAPDQIGSFQADP